MKFKHPQEDIMNIKSSLQKLALITISVFVLLSCKVTPEDPAVLESPQNVQVSLLNGFPVVSWDGVSGADNYGVFVSQDGGDFSHVGNSASISDFQDPTPFGASDLQYAVRSYSGEGHSVLSAPSGVMFVNVQNVYADKFSSANKIEIRWDRHEQADSYTIKRFDSANQAEDLGTVVLADYTPNSALFNISFDDTNADLEETYWYRVYFINDLIIEGENAPLQLGICSSSLDYNEPDNNDYQTLDPNTIINPADSAAEGVFAPISNFLYSINNDSGGRFDDIDWFGIDDPVNTVYTIEYVFDPSTYQLDPRTEINVAVRFNDNIRILSQSNALGNKFSYILEQDILDANCPLYFKLIPVVGADADKFGNYTFQVKPGLGL